MTKTKIAFGITGAFIALVGVTLLTFSGNPFQVGVAGLMAAGGFGLAYFGLRDEIIS